VQWALLRTSLIVRERRSQRTPIETAWPGLAVEDSNLTVQTAALRRALGEVSGRESWIVTLPRRGYRFVGPIVTKSEAEVPAAPLDPAARPSRDDANVLGYAAQVIGYFEPDINPAIAHQSGRLRLWAGQTDLGIEHFEKALR
jgi:hypothetical protein